MVRKAIRILRRTYLHLMTQVTPDTQTIKTKLVNAINASSDHGELIALEEFLEARRSQESNDWWHALSDHRKANIEKGLAQAKVGEYFTSEEMKARLKIFGD